MAIRDWSAINLNATNTLPPVDRNEPTPSLSFLPLPVLLVATPLMMLVIVVAVGGNVLVLMSFRRGSLLVDAHSLYLLNLAVSDLLISVLCMPLHLLSTIFSSGWPLGSAMCKAYTAVQLTLLNVTTFVLVLVAQDGLMQANVGVRSTVAEAKRRAYVLLGACWVLAAVVHVPETLVQDITMERSVVPDNMCKPEFFRSTGQVLFLQMWDFFLPVLVLSVVNTKLYFRLKRLSLTVLAYGTGWQTQPGIKYKVCYTSRHKALSDIHIACTRTCDFNESAAVTFHSIDERPEEKNHFSKPGTSGKENEYRSQSDHAAISAKEKPASKVSASKVSLRRKLVGLGEKEPAKMKTSSNQRDRRRRDGSCCNHKGVYAPAVDLSGTYEGGKAAPGSVIFTDSKGSPEPRLRRFSPDRPRRLKRVAIILFTLVLILVICWLPYSVAFLVSSVCDDCVHPILYGVLVWILYCKSCINPFLYAYNTFAFRNKFRRLLSRVFPIKRLRRIPTDRVSNERASIRCQSLMIC